MNLASWNPEASSARRLIVALAACGAVLLAIGLTLPPERVHRLFSEEGIVERGSSVLWVALAALALLKGGRPTLGDVAGALVALACAAREADFHKRFTGFSVLKPAYYLKEAHPPGERALVAGLVMLLGVSAAVLGARVLGTMWSMRRRLPAWAMSALIGLVTLAFSKALDRGPKMLEDLAGVEVREPARAALHALEEGLESVLPLVFALSVVLHARWKRGGRPIDTADR